MITIRHHFAAAAGALALCCLGGAAGAAEAAAKPFFSTTIDFLDMAFYDRIGEKEYYSLESYESRIKAFADAGIRRINLRTNVLGLTFYKSKFTRQYGENGAYHYTDFSGSQRLIETLKRYDPLTETIRLGHKYGMEVWCWDNITDEAGRFPVERYSVQPPALADYERNGKWPFLDPFFRAHPECWASAKPIDLELLAAVNYRAQRFPIGKIELIAYIERPPINFTADDIAIWYSYDNRTYKRYDKPFTLTPKRGANGRNRVLIERLNIAAPFVKITHPDIWPADHVWTLPVEGQTTSGNVYNTRGEKITAIWGYNWGQTMRPPAPGERWQENSELLFNSMKSCALDNKRVQIGFFAGAFPEPNQIVGLVEFCNPIAMQHKLDRFSELAAYPFDGYRLSLNCHCDVDDPDRFSYNPALRARLLEKTGKDIWRDELPLERILEERASGFSEYLEGCKKLIGDRPLYMYGWEHGGREHGLSLQRTNMGSLKWQYERLIKNGTIAGVVMYDDFAKYFTPRVTGGRKIDLGLYRSIELKPDKVFANLEADLRTPGLTELELYGSVVFRSGDFLQRLKAMAEKMGK